MSVRELVLVALLLAIWLALVVVLCIRWVGLRERQHTAGSSPEEILRHRFARGEISEEELGEMLRALGDSRAP